MKSLLAKKRIIFLSIFVGMYLIVSMRYSLGRIDSGVTRTGWSTMLALMFYLPAIAFMYFSKAKHRLWLIPAVILLCSVSLTIRKVQLPDPASFVNNTHAATEIKASDILVNGADIGIPSIGTAVMEQWHLSELMELKQLLSRYLRPGDTYLDLTNRTARYIYMNHPVPIFDAAPYTTPSTDMQKRVIASLIRKPPSLIVIGPSRIDHDGTPMSLRSSLIYRYVSLNYVPLMEGNFVFMLHPSRVPPLDANLRQQCMDLLHDVFSPEHLVGIPASWGHSWEGLSPLFQTVARLDNSDILGINSLRFDGNRSFSYLGSANPGITYSLQGKNITGRNAGYALVTYDCNDGSPTNNGIQVSWQEKNMPFNPRDSLELSAPNGRLLIPLESNPRWLLSDEIATLNLQFPIANCKSFSVNDVQLLKRSDVVY